MPIPINVIVRVARAVYFWTLNVTETRWEQSLREQYIRGANDALSGRYVP